MAIEPGGLTTMKRIQNPILKGFNPDPSICRVGEDYYIATSTFEWFPGVQIHHSKDMVNWELITRPLDETRLLDMKGTPDSTGVWAPCLTHHDGMFYLIYSNVRNMRRMKDSPNYLTTATNIMGPWSDPVYLNCSGFDPSLFHDDGKKWLVNMKWETLYGEHPFAGILLQEYDSEQKKLVGPIKNIFEGTLIRLTEGPHIYKRDGYYYLMLAEGGTGYEHAVSLVRSRNIDGPYETHPSNPVITGNIATRYESPQKAGHGSLVETIDGESYITHLASRPIVGTDRCILGRETSISKVEWKADGWLYMKDGGNYASHDTEVPLGYEGETAFKPIVFRDDFDQKKLGIHWNTLRIPATLKILSLIERPNYLRLYGRESLESTFTQSLVARRQQHFNYTAKTRIEFKPETSLHMAGLVCYYNTQNYYYLRMTFDGSRQQYCLGILASQNSDESASMKQADNVFFDELKSVDMKVEVNGAQMKFYYCLDGNKYSQIGGNYDATTLSDDFAYLKDHAFTGAFVGVCCQDLAYGGHPADFEYFEYIEFE